MSLIDPRATIIVLAVPMMPPPPALDAILTALTGLPAQVVRLYPIEPYLFSGTMLQTVNVREEPGKPVRGQLAAQERVDIFEVRQFGQGEYGRIMFNFRSAWIVLKYQGTAFVRRDERAGAM